MKIEHSDKKYRVLRELGRGHSGTVYLALDPRGQEVAIKCLASQCNESVLQRFRQEFATLRSLQHANIAQPIDFGYDEGLLRHFFVAEYVSGSTLDIALHTASEEEAARLFAQALRALDYMHRQGVFHCDLKPGNILVTQEGTLKIIDFDVAVRGTQAIGGTPSYCAPELLTGDDPKPNAKTDLFSLGATFYHCLTREKPYQARNFSELVVAHGTQKPKLPSVINPRLGSLWDGLLMGMMQPQASQRYATASAVLQQLYPLLEHRKAAFSEEDIAYRLRQHGIPIGKTEILDRMRSFLESKPADEAELHLALVRGGPGLGRSYLSSEFKAMAQLKGFPCFVSEQREDLFPEKFPFVWIVEDFSARLRQEGPEFASGLAAKLRELAYKGAGKVWLALISGVEDFPEIPDELQALFRDAALSFVLRPWTRQETRAWLEDIFQTTEIPAFLIDHVQTESQGRPQHARQLLQHYLRRGLLLDPQGNWRKDLFQPSEFFRRSFAPEKLSEEYEDLHEALGTEEKELLSALALAYEALPGEFFETLLGRESVYASLRQLTALGLVSGGGEEPYRLASAALKEFLGKKIPADVLREEHRRWALLAETRPMDRYFSEEALLYHRAHGGDPKIAAEAWAAFGDRNARRGLWQSAEEFYTKALDAAPESERELRFRAAIDRGRCLVQRTRLDEAKAYFEELLKKFTAEKNQNRLFLAKICERLGVIENKRGHASKAAEYFRAGIRCLEPGREPLEQYLGLRNFLSALDLQDGRFAEAIAAFKESYESAQRLPWERRRVLTNNDLGAALLQSGAFEAAVAHWNSELADLRSREDLNPYVRCLYQLGQAWLARGEKERAKEFLERAWDSARGLQNPEMELRIANALANLEKDSRPEAALADYERALDAAFSTHETLSIAVVLMNMGFLLSDLGQGARARQCLKQGLRYLEGIPEAGTKFAEHFKEARDEIAKLETSLHEEARGGLSIDPVEKT
ncbi:MAG: protein kinase [Deltaproteobacteria bacterium]|nr:protein kinase [Deltaproteobacteria bacterium]